MNGSKPVWQVQNNLPGAVWPAIASGDHAAVLGLLFQFERSQWLPAEALLELQVRQLEALLKHAHASVPWYRERLENSYDPSRPLTAESLSALPILTRRELQGNFEALKSQALPQGHGSAGETRTSGSTGAPARVLKTHVTQLFWRAFTLRDHLWHRRDFRGKLAAIRLGVESGESGNWGAATAGLIETGPVAVLHMSADIDSQLQWLAEQQPDYLMTYPSNAAELATTSLARGIRFPRLRELRTIGELLTQEVRGLVRQAWGVPVVDLYSADEVGYIALQCPEHEHYHVQSEGVFVEVLDEHGKPCAPGQPGRVVITDMHNFATPLIRYDIGDFAETGAPCPCGRGLPVLRRVVGRVRNILVAPTGERYWPSFGMRKLTEITKILQYQFVQKETDLIQARLVTSAALTPDEERILRNHILSHLPPKFRLAIDYCERIQRGAGGKYEEFVSELAVVGAR